MKEATVHSSVDGSNQEAIGILSKDKVCEQNVTYD
jgi:hypothetical protein